LIEEYKKSYLENGICVVTHHLPQAESFALGAAFNVGSRDEIDFPNGIAHFMEHILFRGTKKLTARQIAYQFEKIGAYANAYTTKDSTLFYVRALKNTLIKNMNLLADLCLNPRFNEKEIEKERSVIIEEINSYDDDYEEMVFDVGDNLLFANSPLGNPILGTKKTVNSISKQHLELFHQHFYSPNNLVVAYVGNAEHKKILSLVRKAFQLNKEKVGEFLRLLPAVSEKKNEILYRNQHQSHLLIGRRCGGYQSKERDALIVLNTMLGDGMSSRLYQKVREKSALAYSIYSTLQLYSDCGAFYIYAGLDVKNLEKTQDLIFKEMAKLSDGVFSKAELNRAKEQVKSGIAMENESLSSRMQSLIKDEFAGIEHRSEKQRIEDFAAISLDNVKSVCQEFFNPQEWSVATIAPKKRASEKVATKKA